MQAAAAEEDISPPVYHSFFTKSFIASGFEKWSLSGLMAFCRRGKHSARAHVNEGLIDFGLRVRHPHLSSCRDRRFYKKEVLHNLPFSVDGPYSIREVNPGAVAGGAGCDRDHPEAKSFFFSFPPLPFFAGGREE